MKTALRVCAVVLPPPQYRDSCSSVGVSRLTVSPYRFTLGTCSASCFPSTAKPASSDWVSKPNTGLLSPICALEYLGSYLKIKVLQVKSKSQGGLRTTGFI